MKRFLSVLCVIAMVFSLCTFNVMAEEGVLSEITAESLAVSGGVNQIPASLVTSLTLPEIEGVTWESSNPEVLSNDGTVTRPIVEDADVTLTAKTATEEKTFNYTIKAQTTNMIYQDSFAYEDRSKLFLSGGWSTYGGTDTTSDIAVDGDNKYASFDFETNGAWKRKILSDATGDVIKLSFDVKPDASKDVTVSVRLNGQKISDGTEAVYTFTLVRFNQGTARPGAFENFGAFGRYDGESFFHIDAKINIVDKTFSVSYNGGNEVGPFHMENQRNGDLSVADFTSGNYSFDRIDMVRFTRTSSSVASGYVAVDNFSVSTEVEVDDLISSLENAEKVQYVKKQIMTALTTSETAGGITQDIALGEYAGVEVDWNSQNPGITISDDGKTAVVTQTEAPQWGMVSATITSGDVSETVNFPFTVAPLGTHQIRNGALEEDFETYQEGAELSWAPQYSTAKGVVVRDDVTGSLTGKFVRQGTENANKVHAWRLYNTAGNYKWTERYILSLDIKYNPSADGSKVYIRQMGVLGFNYIGLDYDNKEAILGNVGYGSSSDKKYILRDDANMNFSPDEWVHIDIDFNAAKRETMMYVNGVAVSESPMEIADNYINPDYSMPMRGFDIALAGEGVVSVDNVSVRAFDEAEVFDENADFTVTKFAITNQKGETIRNIGASTTSVKATLRVNKNRDAVSGNAKMFLALYDAKGKLVQIISEDITEGTYGYPIVNAEIPLEGDCTGYSARAFLLCDGKISPLTEKQDMNKEIVFDDDLFDKEVNYTLAKDLGYSEFESTYDSDIQAIFFDGEDCLGNPTKHFAYFGVPEGASASDPVPAVVLVHGGGGSAFDEWVKIWNDRGYAAIAMDMNGKLPNAARTNHAWAGAENEYYGSRKAVDGAKDVWMYQCMTEVILAHNLLMQDERIDADKTGITGISWGGIITSTAIGVDKRFKFAVPVYGCGYLYEMDSYMGKTVLDDEMIDWDPSEFTAKADKNMPTLWINGDLDGNFAIDGFSKTAELMGDQMNIVIKPNMTHGHQAGYWEARVPEIYSFADSVTKGGASLMKVNAPVVSDNIVTVTVSGGENVLGKLYYTDAESLLYDDATGTVPEYSFTAIEGISEDGTEWTFNLPEGAKKFYVTFDYTLNGKTHKASTKFVSLN